MNVKELSTMVASIIVAFLVLVTVMVPIVSNAMEESQPITEYNIGTKQTYREAKVGDVFKLESNYNTETSTKTDVWTLNGDSVLNPNQSALSWNLGIISDAFWIEIYANNNASAAWRYIDRTDIGYVSSSESNPSVEWVITIKQETIDWTYSLPNSSTPQTLSLPYSWAYVPCSIEEGGYMSSSHTEDRTSIVTDMNDIILCGTYTSGELDTGYWYHKGDIGVGNTSYTGSNTTTLTLKDGTYDLYDADISFSVTDGTVTEEFKPYRALVPYEVHGHADSGVVHTLLGILPVFVAIGLLLGIGSWIYISRRT